VQNCGRLPFNGKRRGEEAGGQTTQERTSVHESPKASTFRRAIFGFGIRRVAQFHTLKSHAKDRHPLPRRPR